MLINLRLSFAFVLLCSAVISSLHAQAQDPLNCIEKSDKPLVCEHLIIKIADPRVVRRSRIQGSPICICLSDFPLCLRRKSIYINIRGFRRGEDYIRPVAIEFYSITATLAFLSSWLFRYSICRTALSLIWCLVSMQSVSFKGTSADG